MTILSRKLRSQTIIAWSGIIKIVAGINMISFSPLTGNIQKATLVHNNIPRVYKLYIPHHNNDTIHMPLVIVLHGRGANGESMMLLTRKGFNRLADKDCFMVAYPDGIEMNWNDGRRDEESKDRAHTENIDDVGFISVLIDTIIKENNADPRRVYVTGISNGAIMAYRLACELSPKISAIAPVDGNIPVTLFPECSPLEPVSVLAINNTHDPLVPFEGGEIHGKFEKVRLGRVLSVAESIDFWVSMNKCTPVPVISELPDRDPYDGTRVTVKEYLNGTDSAEVILYTIDGGGHTWPGGLQYLPARMIGKTCRDFDANEIIWSFFKKHSKSFPQMKDGKN